MTKTKIVFIEKPADSLIVKTIRSPEFIWVITAAKEALAKAVALAQTADERNSSALRYSGAEYVSFFAQKMLDAEKVTDVDITLSSGDLVKDFEKKVGKVRFE